MLDARATLVQAATIDETDLMALKTAKTRWRDVILVCKKCQKKLGKGFGPDEDLTLKKALTRYVQPEGKGRKSELAVMYVDCFDVCPKKAVTAVNAAQPAQMIIIPAGADLIEVTDRLGIERRPGKRKAVAA
jgi:predicted metal-binding protein